MNLHRGFTFQLSRLAPPTIIAIAILVLRPAAGAVGFLAATQYPVGYFPSEAVVADFNNDGHPDVASANTFSFSISILLNNGDGTFAPALDIPVQGTPQGVVSRDFNGDGKADLVVPADNTMDFLAGNGDGTFQPAVTYPVGGTSADKSNAGDFNGDSKMDVVAFVSGWPGGKDGFVVLLGDGNGTFASPIFTESDPFPKDIVPVDMDKDGKLDVVLFAFGTLQIYRGKGNGGFQRLTSYSIQNGEGLAAGDLNGDGKSDLVVAGYDGKINVFLGNGDGSVQGPTTYSAGESWAVTIADLNSDGKADVVTAGPYASVLFANGDGTLQPAVYYAATATRELGSISVLDVSGDGVSDLVACNYGGTVGIALGLGAGEIRAPHVIPVTGYLGQLVKGDFNGDSKTDVASVDGSNNTVDLYLGNGDGTFQAALVYTVGKNPDSLAATDFNGDNKLDLAVANKNSGNVSVLLGRGDGTFTPAKSYRVYNSALYVVTGDFNNDARPDIAAMTGFQTNGKMSVLINQGNGTFYPMVDYTTHTAPVTAAVGDFNHDGSNDLAVYNQYSFDISIMMGRGDGTFQPAVNMLASASAPFTIRTADFNNDGKLDLAQGTTFGLNVLPGNGDGSFQAGILTSAIIFDIAVGDFDGDGKRDVAANAHVGFNLFLGNGDFTFDVLTYGTNAGSLVAGDFNGDNALDLVLNNSGLVTELNMGGTVETLVSSANPSHVNQPVTFTATVNFTVPYSPGTPTGQIRFQDGNQLLGNVALSGGQASFTTSGLVVGNHNIRALYSGDANYNRNLAMMQQRVRP